jgi:hypothetical protein
VEKKGNINHNDLRFEESHLHHPGKLIPGASSHMPNTSQQIAKLPWLHRGQFSYHNHHGVVDNTHAMISTM